ncbi:MarR family transcriptional regulator [Clostridium sp. PL3]|uniref:MarR family transcriptional regulator n=1 Tax=Clostridium thailandense TaxID=2794346 RepID=A0A949WQA6_9CLOT|nr:MarR family transcriptional regulator [Clostridium thailandense]MBV7272511.1 MarR family transcriptional regulator [Clostridium thailandense]
MCKNPVDVLAENLITFLPVMIKKIIKFDTAPIKMPPLNQLMVLGLLQEEGSSSISELCKNLTISRPQMTIVIDKLVDLDLVYRVHNESDRRTININVTEKGKKYCLEISEMVKENLKSKLMNLSQEDLSILLRSIDVAKNIFKKLE